MAHENVTIRTEDGECPTYVYTPPGGGAAPAVVCFSDAGGIRPGALGIGERLAEAGYVALVPDLFYRFGPYEPLDPVKVFAGDVRAILGPLMSTTGNAAAARDAGPMLAYLSTRSDVSGTAVGAVGFCMGGGMAIAAAGTYPERFKAVASFHGGRLATDAPDSPHTFAPHVAAAIYVGAAENDSGYPPEMAERFEAALAASHVRYEAETYQAAHGWMMPDFPVYDRDEAERGWREMLAFFDRILKPH